MTQTVHEKRETARQPSPGAEPIGDEATILREVLRAVRGVRHGHVQMIVQDHRVVQVDRTEKVRLVR